MIIGLTGTKGSGKGEVANFLKMMGFNYLSLSDMVRAEAKKTYSSPTARQLSDIGNRLRQENGPGILAKIAAKKIEKGNYVVDGIRNPSEVAELRRLDKFYLIAVDANQKLRYERTRVRSRGDCPDSLEEFLEIDSRDLGKGEKKHGQRVMDTMKIADAKIINDGTLCELRESLEQILLDFLKS
jgi:dephospho-CoA kinase